MTQVSVDLQGEFQCPETPCVEKGVVMNDQNAPDMSGIGGMLENWLATQKKFAPSGQVMEQLAEAVRTISQAQISYSQTVMRANAALLAAIWEASAFQTISKADGRERPSKAAHLTDGPAS